MADRDAYLTDPEAVDVPVDALLDAAYHAELAARIDPRRARRRRHPGAGRSAAARSTSASSTPRATRSASSSRTLPGFGSGVVDPATGIHYQNRGAYFSLDPAHPNVLEPRKRTAPHAAARDAVPRRRAAAVGRRRVDGRRRPAADPRPARVGARRRRGRTSGRPWRRRAGTSSRAGMFAPPVEVRARGAPRARRRAEPRGARPRRRGGAAFDGSLGHEHAIELVDGGPAAPAGSLAATTDPRSDGAAGRPVSPGIAGRRCCDAILGGPVAGCAHTICRRPRRPGTREGARDLERRPELPVHERDRGRARGARRAARRRARGPRRHARGRDHAARRATTAGGSGSARPPAARACSTPRATRPRSTPSTSSATGPARRRSCAETRTAPGRRRRRPPT